ncbi:MAG: gluconolactonase [Planctomycetaceae bacterium]|nr:gluconolactonase [Planctomycetaceae bacterium]
MRYEKICCLIILAMFAQTADGQDLFPDTEALQVAGQVAFTEGPTYHPSGNVFFSDIANNRVMRRDPTGAVHIYRTPSGRTNGMLLNGLRLVCCEGGGPEGNRRVTRMEPDGSIKVLTDRYEGKRYNSPNDIAIDSKRRMYFSDPRYGPRDDLELFDADGEPIEGVYRIDPDNRVTRIITHEVDRPNGLAVSADDRYLFVADNVNDGLRAQGGNRKLWRFDLQEDGSIDPASRKLLFDWETDRGPDGMALDREGNLYVTAGFNFPKPPVETAINHRAGVYVFSSEGELLQFLPIPADMVTNCTFGGKDGKTLYVTAGHKLWSIPTSIPGKGF